MCEIDEAVISLAPMNHTITFETRQWNIDVDTLDASHAEQARDCCAQLSFEHAPSLPVSSSRSGCFGQRPAPRDTASIAAAISELRSRCPHLEPPRFPPVVRRVHSALVGGEQRAGASGKAQGKNGKQRRCADKHTLTTRDVVHERGVLALEVTKGRKRVYKKLQSSDKDKKAGEGCPGSFDMVQVRRLCAINPSVEAH